MKASILIAVALLAVLAPIKTEAFQVCGNYCGPGWCEATCESEDVCQFSVPPQANSCTDACCMVHDNCCGYNLSRECNKNLITCLNACPWAADCSGPDGWWHRFGVWGLWFGVQVLVLRVTCLTFC